MSSFHPANFVLNIFRFANTCARHPRRSAPTSSKFPYLLKTIYPITPTTKIYWTQYVSLFHPAYFVWNIFRFQNTCARHLRRSAPTSSKFPYLLKTIYPITPTTKIYWTQYVSLFHPAYFVWNIFRFANACARHLRRSAPKSSTFLYLLKTSYHITTTTKIYWTQYVSSFHPAYFVWNIFRFQNTCARHLRRSAPKSSTFPTTTCWRLATLTVRPYPTVNTPGKSTYLKHSKSEMSKDRARLRST